MKENEIKDREEQLAEIERLGRECLDAFRREIRSITHGDETSSEAAATEKALAEYTKAMLAVFDATKNPGQPH